MEKELSREIVSLNSERRMGELAIQGYQSSIMEKLNGSMGEDMKEVLSGNRKVKFSFWRRIKNKIDKLLWSLNLAQ